VALERTLARVFPYMTGQVLTSGEAEVAGRVASTEEPLALLLPCGRVCLARVGIVVRCGLPFFVIIIQVHIHRGDRLFIVPWIWWWIVVMFRATSCGGLTGRLQIVRGALSRLECMIGTDGR
jgi:hypothetical protein